MKESDITKPSGTTNRGTARKRVSLTVHRAEIQDWVRRGYSDDSIAETLGTTRSSIQSFRSRRGIRRRGGTPEPVPEKRPEASGEGSVSVYEGALDQGEEGYGLWLDPAVADDPLFRRGFAGVSDVTVRIEESRLVLAPAVPTDSRGASGNTGFSDPGADTGAGQTVEELAASLSLSPSTRESPLSGSYPASGSEERGRVKWFEPDRNYGFIVRPDGADLFFHGSQIRGVDTLDSGMEVVYEVDRNRRGPLAEKVSPL